MAWQAHCKYCYHFLTITPESVASDRDADDAALTVTCPSCNRTEEYRAADLRNLDLTRDEPTSKSMRARDVAIARTQATKFRRLSFRRLILRKLTRTLFRFFPSAARRKPLPH